MTINIFDTEILLELASEMNSVGFHHAVFPLDDISDKVTIEFFKTVWEAKEYCFEMTTDADYYKSMLTESLISDLNAFIESGIDIFG